MAWRNIPGNPYWEYDTNPPNPGGAQSALWETGVNGIRTNPRGEKIYMNCRHKILHGSAASKSNEISKTFWDQFVTSFIDTYGDGLAAAYSLRDLNEDGRVIIRVRRSSDNAEKDFTAAEMGPVLEDWVNTNYEVYSSNFSTTQSWSSPGGTLTITSEDGIGGLDDVLELDATGSSGRFGAYKFGLGLESNEKHSVTFRYYTTDSSYSGKYWNAGNAFSNVNVVTSSTNDQIVSDGTWREVTLAFNNENSALRLKITDTSGGANGTLIAGLSGSIYIRDVVLTTTHANGHVATWYEQSENDNDAVQTVAANQPKIVDAGVFLGEIDFDGSQQFQTITLTSSEQPNSIFSVSNTNVAGQTLGIYGTNTNQSGYYRYSNKHAIYSSGTGANALEGSAYVVDTDYLRFDLFNGANSVVGVNGTTTSGTTGDAVLNRLDIGDSSLSGVNPLNGSIKEIIVYNTDQSANRAAIEANIAAAYDITLS